MCDEQQHTLRAVFGLLGAYGFGVADGAAEQPQPSPSNTYGVLISGHLLCESVCVSQHTESNARVTEYNLLNWLLLCDTIRWRDRSKLIDVIIGRWNRCTNTVAMYRYTYCWMSLAVPYNLTVCDPYYEQHAHDSELRPLNM